MAFEGVIEQTIDHADWKTQIIRGIRLVRQDIQRLFDKGDAEALGALSSELDGEKNSLKNYVETHGSMLSAEDIHTLNYLRDYALPELGKILETAKSLLEIKKEFSNFCAESATSHTRSNNKSDFLWITLLESNFDPASIRSQLYVTLLTELQNREIVEEGKAIKFSNSKHGFTLSGLKNFIEETNDPNLVATFNSLLDLFKNESQFRGKELNIRPINPPSELDTQETEALPDTEPFEDLGNFDVSSAEA